MALSKHHSKYLKEDEYVVFHADDPDLPTISVKLPSLESFFGCSRDEALQKVDGYGLDPKEQHFENYRKLGYYSMPDKLRGIEDVVRKERGKLKIEQLVYPQDIFDHIESAPVGYAEEIRWIEKQQLRSENGCWIFIKGKPTYIDGIHYTYQLCWPINNEYRPLDGLPFYRDIDRRIFIFLKWAYTTKSAYFKYVLSYFDQSGEIKEKFFNDKGLAHRWAREKRVRYMLDDHNDWVDMLYRTVFGIVFPKRRRVGGTKQSVFFLMMITLMERNATFAIQALTEKTALQDVYEEKFKVPWNNFWFIFKPAHGGNNAQVFKLYPPKSTLSKEIRPHGGRILPRSSENKAFDGNRLKAYLNDEPGKKKNANILSEFRDTIKNTLAQGQNIHGFAIYVSTFGEIDEGGREFFEMCRRSYANERNDNGHTQTGLITMFLPAYDGYDNCIDIYGESIIDDPDEPYLTLEGRMQSMGSKTVLMNERRHLEQTKDWSGLNEHVRNNPWILREANRKKTRTQNFDTESLIQQIAELKYGNPKTWRVNLRWSDNLSLTQRAHTPSIYPVIENDEEGKWVVSMLPPTYHTPKTPIMVWDAGAESWTPSPLIQDKFVTGIDPIQFNVKDLSSTAKEMSSGAAIVKMKYDPILDPPDRPKDEWVSNRIVMHYLGRPDTTLEFNEDMLLMTVAYGTQACVERQAASELFRDWKAWGFGSYLMYMYNTVTGKMETAPGLPASTESHQLGFGYIRSHIKAHGRREVHVEVLEQVLDTEDFEDVTKNDLFAAFEMAEIGSRNTTGYKAATKVNSSVSLKGLIKLYN